VGQLPICFFWASDIGNASFDFVVSGIRQQPTAKSQ
jgi:hypothetical protein